MKNPIISKSLHLLGITLVVASALLNGCQKEKHPKGGGILEDTYRAIVGEWEWTESIYIDQTNQARQTTTPQTENKTIRQTFMENLTSTLVETRDNLSTQTNYEYIIIREEIGFAANTLYLKSTDIHTKQVHVRRILFKNKDTLIFLQGLNPVKSYYVRR